MKTLEIIALIAEPDSDVRMASIKRLALLETQPQVRLDIKSVHSSPFPNVAVSVVLSNDNQVDLKPQDIEQINKFVPKPPIVAAYVCGFGKIGDDFKLSLNDGSHCYINKNSAIELCTLVKPPLSNTKPSLMCKIEGWVKSVGIPTRATLTGGDIIDISDLQIAAMYNKIVKVENKSHPMNELIEMLDKLGNPSYDMCDILEDYKRWRKTNM